MKTLFALLKNTFRETIRDRILLVIVFFGVAFLFATQLLSAISAQQDEKILLDLGLGMIDIFGMLVTIFVGTQLIFREIHQKTIFILLSKPITRRTFLLSKFFGLGAILTLITVIMLVVFLGVLFFSTDILMANGSLSFLFLGKILITVFFSLLSFLLLLALVLLFSSFLSPTIAAFSSLTMFVIGHLTDDIRLFSQNDGVSSSFRIFADAVYFLLPNFSSLNLKNFLLHDFFFTIPQLFAAAGGALLWILLSVVLGTALFSRKEF